MAERKTKLYHYTSKENAAKIRQSGEIRPSTHGAFGGNKVYLTAKPPSKGKAAIARNNYDSGARGHWEKRESRGAVDVPIKVKIPESKVTKEKTSQGRDVYTHKGPIKL